MYRPLIQSVASAILFTSVSLARADETTNVALPHIEPIQLSYRAFDPQHVLIEEGSILSAISAVSNGMTRFHMREGQPDTKDAVLDTGGRTRLNRPSKMLLIQYLAHSRYLSGGFTGTTLTIPVAYNVERTANRVNITLSFPDTAPSERHGMPLLTRKLWDMGTILDDYSHIAEGLRGVELHLNYEAKGELESQYKQDAVLGNLERMLGRSNGRTMPANQISSSGSVTRDGTFVYTVAGVRREVNVATFPYHDGCKLTYSASLPYSLSPDGTASGDDGPQTLRDLLTKVVND